MNRLIAIVLIFAGIAMVIYVHVNNLDSLYAAFFLFAAYMGILVLLDERGGT